MSGNGIGRELCVGRGKKDGGDRKLEWMGGVDVDADEERWAKWSGRADEERECSNGVSYSCFL